MDQKQNYGDDRRNNRTRQNKNIADRKAGIKAIQKQISRLFSSSRKQATTGSKAEQNMEMIEGTTGPCRQNKKRADRKAGIKRR